MQALWLYQAFNQPPSVLLDELLAAKDAHIRAAAVRVMPVDRDLARLPRLVADENPRVRLAAVRALGQVGSVRAADLALGVLGTAMDPFLDYALWLTVNDLATPWLAAVKSGAWNTAGREAPLEFALRAIEPSSDTIRRAAANFMFSVIREARDSSAPLKRPGNASKLLT